MYSYSNRTIKDICVLLRSILDEAVLLQYLEKNPAIGIKTPKRVEDIKTKGYMDVEDVAVFKMAIQGHRLETAFLLGLYYGLRREEILGLQWKSIHSDGKLYIEHTVSRVSTMIRKNRVKTDASYRCYPIANELRQQLACIKKQQEQNRIIYGADYVASDYIFTWEDGRPYSTDYLTKSFKKVIRSIPELDQSLTLHSLRGACVSILIHEGIDIKDIQEWVGHKDIHTTLNIYARVNERQKEKVNQKMIQTLFSAGNS